MSNDIQPYQREQLEIAFLSSCVITQDIELVNAALRSGLKPEHLSKEETRNVLQVLYDIVEAGGVPELTAVWGLLAQRGQMSAASVTHGGDLPEFNSLNGRIYLGMLLRHIRVLHVHKALKKATMEIESGLDPDTVISTLNNSVNNSGITLAETETFSAAGRRLLDDYMNGKTKTLPTMFFDLDRAIGGGVRLGELVLVAAPPGAGKTALGISVIYNMVDRVVKTEAVANDCIMAGIISCELPVSQIISRMALRYTQDARTSMKHFLDKAAAQRDGVHNDVVNAITAVSRLPIGVASTTDLGDILYRIAEMRSRGARVVFVDYIQLITTIDNHQTRNEMIATVSRRLKQAAINYNMVIIAATQYNRAGDPKAPKLSDLRDSGSLEQDADTVIALIPDDGMSDARVITRYVTILKNRNGGAPGARVPLGWIGQKMAYVSIVKQ